MSCVVEILTISYYTLSVGSDEDMLPPILTEEVISQLKNNDTNLTFLRVDLIENGLIQTSINWAELGYLIGVHTHLKELHIDATMEEWDYLIKSGEFFNDIAANKSVEHLVLMGPSRHDMFSGSCLEQNTNLRCLELRDCHVGSDGYVALGRLIQYPECKLQELHIVGGDLTKNDSSISVIRDALANNTSVKKLRLSFYAANHPSVRWTCRKSSIEELTIEDPYAMDIEELSEFGSVLKDNTTLKTLKLNFGDDAKPEGWMTFFLSLRENRSLEDLDLSWNNLNDNCMTCLMTILSSNTTLRTLRLESLRHVTSEGWASIYTLYLRSPTCMLESLYLGHNTLNATTFRKLSTSNRRTLKNLYLTLPTSDRSLNTVRCGWNPFINMLARTLHNKDTVDGTFNSNHMLERICYEHEEDRLARVMSSSPLVGKNLPTYLMQNRVADKFALARRKIIESHYYDVDHIINLKTRRRGYKSLMETIIDTTNDMETPELLPLL